jgi:hypothetical protein
VHVRIDEVPRDVRLVAGITATVRIASPQRSEVPAIQIPCPNNQNMHK